MKTDRATLLARLRDTPRWDVIVIGGGATGLGCGLDAAARGHRTLLLEAGDFAQGTSSRSTKLIHGGVRYLAQGRLGLVREALAERATLLAIAPHLVKPQAFVVPVHGTWEKSRLGLGLKLYDRLAGSRSLGPSRIIGPAETLSALPTLKPDGVSGGIHYMDARFDDAGLAIALMRTMFNLGGLPINHLPVTALRHRHGRICGVDARDAESGEEFSLEAAVIINACGVWADDVRQLDDDAPATHLAPSQGAHLVVDRDFLPGNAALLIPHTADGRVLFVIPWQGKVLMGTTDTPRADHPLEPRPFPAEIDFILDTAARYLRRPPRREDVRSAFAGLRPLVAGGSGATASLSREHLIQLAPSGLLSVTGGKWTTYRRMGEEIINRAETVGNLPPRVCPTASLPLVDDRVTDPDDPPLHPALPLSASRVRHALRYEQARSLDDVLARRSRALFTDARAAMDCAPAVARIMAEELAWSAEQTLENEKAFRQLAEGFL